VLFAGAKNGVLKDAGMSSKVFFSWQSDTSTKEGRNVIEKALQSAVARIAGDLEVEDAVRHGLQVDKDTQDVSGSPPIFQTILGKIDRASVFVADLTFCGFRLDGRPTPNPNVLIEYGWALKSLGYSQIVAVMNDAHGEPTRESMPFDLASLRFPIRYKLPDGAPDSTRVSERDQLSKRLETALRGVFASDEFKAKLPKQPEPPRFRQQDQINGRARFRPLGKPVAYARDHIAQMMGSSETKPVYLPEGPAMWLRLMPLYDPGQSWLTQEIKQLGLELAILPLMVSTGSIGFAQDEDGCCFYPPFDDDKTYSIAYVFNTGEVWVTNATLVRTGDYIPLEEPSFAKTLEGCALFLERLGCAGPYKWIAGIEGIKGRQLAVGGRLRSLGVCFSNIIEEEGIYKKGEIAAEVLRPFFEKVYDKCGARRPPDS
jgi:hypothetical protein